MKRRLLAILSALSLLLCVAVVALWVRSYRLTDQVSWRCDRGWRSVRSGTGHVVVDLLLADWSGHPEEFHGPRYQREQARPHFNWLLLLGGETGDTYASWQRGGFAWHEKRNARRGTLHAIAVAPFWSIAAVAAILPLTWTTARWRARHRRRSNLGLCPCCNYDLRASSNHCPECGTPIPAHSKQGVRPHCAPVAPEP